MEYREVWAGKGKDLLAPRAVPVALPVKEKRPSTHVLGGCRSQGSFPNTCWRQEGRAYLGTWKL